MSWDFIDIISFVLIRTLVTGYPVYLTGEIKVQKCKVTFPKLHSQWAKQRLRASIFGKSVKCQKHTGSGTNNAPFFFYYKIINV